MPTHVIIEPKVVIFASQLNASLEPDFPHARYARHAKHAVKPSAYTGTPLFKTLAKIRGALPSCASMNRERDEE